MSFVQLRRFASCAIALWTLTPLTLPAQSSQTSQSSTGPFTVEQVLSAPFPTELGAAPTGQRIAWAFFERGRRNVYVAEGPAWEARRLTSYEVDDGQELTSVQISADGKWVIYARGGDHGSNWPEGGLQPNPTSLPVPMRVEIFAVPFAGGSPTLLAAGDDPVVSPASDRVIYSSGGQIWTVPIDGSAPGTRLIFTKGSIGSPRFSPDGSRIAFVSNRGDHSFIGVFNSERESITWLAPSTNRDQMPRWSPDGTRLAFVRRPGAGGIPALLLERRPNPWQIWTADARTGEGRIIWKSPETLWGSIPTSNGGANLHWMAGGRIAFLATLDGRAHLYSIAETGGQPMLLTPGEFMCEYISPSPDGRFLVYSANHGPLEDDIDRRHVFRVPVDQAEPVALTPGRGIETQPVVTGDGATVAYVGGTASRPSLPMVVNVNGGSPRALAEDRVPRDFPAQHMTTPRSVTFRAADGLLVHGQLFDTASTSTATGGARRPAVVFVHGGPPRQMLVGWHYMFYYSNTYAINQYLASRGYVVLAVNYRLGIGYGWDFHHPANASFTGASEYLDVKAAGEYLAALPNVDPARIGIYGGSYGGFLTALALGRDSPLFAAGVDLHGVHDWTSDGGRRLGAGEWRYEEGDFEEAAKVAWASSPVSSVSTWTSPVLLIHGDDDRNVRFHQTVDLARRLEAKGVTFEEFVIPDEIHDFLLYRSWTAAAERSADFLHRMLRR